MNLLSNSTIQFVISISLNIILGGINLWLTVRRTDGLPLAYETISQEPINPSDAEVKQLLTNLHISFDDTRIQHLRFITFKLWHSGKKPVTLDDEKKPLIIAFEGTAILACQQVEPFPEDLEYSCHLDGGKLLLVLPQLEPKESLTVRILVPIYLYDFPDIRVRGRAPKRIMKANNVRRSREMLIIGIFYLFATTYMFFALKSKPPSPIQGQLWLFLVAGLLFFGISWADRKMPPSEHMLPSEWFLLFFMITIRMLPVLIPIGIVAFMVYHWFGIRVLTLLYLISMMLFVPFAMWYLGFSSIIGWLKKKQKKYNAVLIGILTSIPFLAFYAMCASVVIDMLKH